MDWAFTRTSHHIKKSKVGSHEEGGLRFRGLRQNQTSDSRLGVRYSVRM